ncbi:MAG: FHA domain-containing protein [Pseudomonadota bacterium]
MATTAIELNDAGILAVRDGTTLLESPGIALFDGGTVLTGTQASARARVKPGAVANRFWDGLSLDSPSVPAGSSHNHADLAYLHLDAIRREIDGDQDDYVLCVPGSFTRQQLGLLLGITRECKMNVVGLVDSAVAAASQAGASGRVLHLDAQLHRIVLTELESGQSLARVGLHEINRFGLLNLRETWADTIADAFVSNTRFDPMHMAASEQQLYDKLPDWLNELHDNPQAPIALGTDKSTHTVSVAPERLARASADYYQQIVQLINGRTRPGDRITLLLSHRLAAFPGLKDQLAQLGDEPPTEQDAGESARGALAHLSYLRSSGDALSFVTSLPLSRSRATLNAPTGASPAPRGTPPTHIVYGSRIYRIGNSPLVVGASVPDDENGFTVRSPAPGVSRRHFALQADGDGVLLTDSSTYGTFVNGAQVEEKMYVKAGDAVTIGSPAQSLALVAEVK